MSGFGLSFQPAMDQTPSERQSTVSALGPGQKALKILALHLPKMTGAMAMRTAQAPSRLAPDAAVFRALVQSIQGAPTGGFPETDALVESLGQLSPERSPAEFKGPDVVPPPTAKDIGPTGNLLGPNGEWLPGFGELGGPVSMDDPESATYTPPAPFDKTKLFASLVSQLGGGR